MRMTVIVIVVVTFVAALRMVAVVVVVAFAFAFAVSVMVMSAMVCMPMRALRMVAMIVACAVRVRGMVVCVIMSAMVRMPMRALRMVVMIMACAVRVSVIVIVIVIVIVRVSVMFIEDLLRERVVLYKRLVMPVLVTAAIRARLRLERSARVIHVRAQTLEHVFQHRIGFQFQLSRGHFHRRVPVAQVVRGARERNRIVGVYNQHILRCAITRTRPPSSATSMSPSRSTVPRGSTSATSSPLSSVAARRLLQRSSKARVSVGARLINGAAIFASIRLSIVRIESRKSE